MNHKGQTILTEYVMIIFVVVAALVAITVYVQRGLQARIHDARNFAIYSFNNACDTNCQQAAGGNVTYEYEPYYMWTLADTFQNGKDSKGITNGISADTGEIYKKVVNDSTQTIATSVQLPPECAGANPPSYC